MEEFNGPQGRILYVLWQTEAVPIVELSQKTGLAKNTLTAMLGRMEENGLICRKQNQEDRRRAVISLTEKARKLEGKYEEVSQQMNALFFRGFAEEEIAALDGLLGRVLDNLQEIEETQKKGRNGYYGEDKRSDRQ